MFLTKVFVNSRTLEELCSEYKFISGVIITSEAGFVWLS